jgi:hypothetical protein
MAGPDGEATEQDKDYASVAAALAAMVDVGQAQQARQVLRQVHPSCLAPALRSMHHRKQAHGRNV